MTVEPAVLDRAPRPGVAPPTPTPTTARRDAGVLIALGVAVVVAGIIASGIGAFPVAPTEVLRIVAARLGLVDGTALDATATSVVLQIRLPRVLLAALVGAALSLAGALLQGMFRNPLAEPGIIGVSAGAAVGAVVAILLGFARGPLGVTAAAFVGGIGTTFLVYGVAKAAGAAQTVTLVLSGIAVNAIAGSIIGMALFVSDDAQLRSITFWNLGSMGAATWTAVVIVGVVTLVGAAVAVRVAPHLDLLALGEAPARHLGVDVDRLRVLLVVVAAALAAAGVAVAGIISFVGLVVPHLIRLTLGPQHRLLVPAAALGGGLLLVLGDLLARTAAAPAEIPLGAITGLLGGPFFFWLLLRRRAAGGLT